MRSGKNVQLVGYILPKKNDLENTDSENDEEEEEPVPEFLNMKEMDTVSSGGFMFRRAVLATEEVDFMFNGKKVRVGGRFPLQNPWWEISSSAQQYARKLVIDGYPAYGLRTDLKNDVLSLFLKECNVEEDFIMEFMKWLPNNRSVNLQNLEKAVCEFGESSNSNMKEASDYVQYQITKSDAAFYVRSTTTYPYIMKHLPTLLPGQFLNLLKKGNEEEKDKWPAQNAEKSMEDTPQKCKVSLLARLEELIKTEVWKFGFGYVMYKELQLVRCETTLKNFESSELFSKMSAVQQNALRVYNQLKVYCKRFGHTYIEQKVLCRECRNMAEESIWDAVAFLRQHGVLKVEKEKIALRNLYNYEKEIAECLHQIIVGEPWKIDLNVREVLQSAARGRMRDQPATNSSSSSGTNAEAHQSALSRESTSDMHSPMKEIPEATSDAGLTLDPDQVQAAEMMCANPVTVISGKGGCGKTTVVSAIFKAAMEQQGKNLNDNNSVPAEDEQKEKDKMPMEVLLTAPTGRAASLLTKKTCFTAYTMHQVLWSYMLAKKNQEGSPLNWKFAEVRVLVVDEGSLVCVQILSSILSMLTKHAQLQKFIILGDIRQLPSIDPGNVLNDLFTSLKKVNWAIEMRTNHRAESKLIVENASLIADMGAKKKFHPLNYDATVELGKSGKLQSTEKSFIEILLPANENYDDLQNSIKFLLTGPAPGLEDHASSQFIAFTRKECALINELCCKHYSNHITKTHKNKMNFQIGDKVCCTRNGYVTEQDKQEKSKDKQEKSKDKQEKSKDKQEKSKDKQEKSKAMEDDLDEGKIEKERLCNGEIFFITQDVTTEDCGQKRNKRRSLTLDNNQGKVLTVDYRELMRECKLRHAWARTIHTFQGSEEKTIVYVLDHGHFQTWQHVYTAVTRGQSRVYVIAKQGGLENAIRRHVIRRNTRLESHVMDMLHVCRKANTDFLLQSSQFQFNTPKRCSYPSAHEPSSIPDLSQDNFAMTSLKNDHLQSAGNCFEGFGSPKSESPVVCKRERIEDNGSSSSKQTQVNTPLGSSQLQHLSLNVTPRQLFPKATQLNQDQRRKT